MNVTIQYNNNQLNGAISLPGSKSESNRTLIIQNLCSKKFNINNISFSNDTKILTRSLKNINLNKEYEIDIESCGTAMRFLTSYCAITAGKWILKGDQRMHERPIKLLVDALINLGADIHYLNKKGYPPLLINGKILNNSNEIQINGDISSQYISSILMIAPILPKGLKININGKIISKPYIKMTLDIMQHFGIKYLWNDNIIIIQNQSYKSKNIDIESDWSSASYWYFILGLVNKFKSNSLFIDKLKSTSRQGDSYIKNIMNKFGIVTQFNNGGAYIKTSVNNYISDNTSYIDCTQYPDIVQGLIVYFSCIKHNLTLTGLQSLKIKETNRILALKRELSKINVEFNEENNNWQLITNNRFINKNDLLIETYNDHRMALSFAAVSILYGSITIKNSNVIEKSYPTFWNDMNKLGFGIKFHN